MIHKYSLLKAKRVLRHSAHTYKKKKSRLNVAQQRQIENDMDSLYAAIVAKNHREAKAKAKKLESDLKTHFKKSSFEQVKEFVFAVAFALVIAFLIRELWFELYEVPTGSMRPTIKEKDRLIVSKTTFGLHLPFNDNLLFFKPDYIKRNGIIVFTAKGMDIPDAKTTYFYLFPGIKRLIKRGIGKPGDTLYFYGGRIYGVDKEGNEITELYDEENLKKLGIENVEHIPYITADGKVTLSSPLSYGVYGSALLHQMNIPVGRMSLNNEGKIEGEFFDGKAWVKDDPFAAKEPHTSPKSYSELWGMGNYAVARLLTKKEATQFYGKEAEGDAVLFLELHHTPNLTYPTPEIKQGEMGKVHPVINPFITLIPLQKEHLEKIQKALFTSRFFVQNGHAFRYQEGNLRPQREEYDPLFAKVPDGLYEIQNGVAYSVGFGGLVQKLPLDHPLYSSTPANIQKLFNLGIHFNIAFNPREPQQPYLPQRFAYFRDGDLYLMGHPILEKNDPTLEKFVNNEKEKEKNSKYIAFVDAGGPSAVFAKKEFIQTFGLKVPENGVLALGDNYTMSSDSRDFGFVPVHNLRGSPRIIFWPFGSRFGTLPQSKYSSFTIPQIIVSVLIIFIAIVATIYYYRRQKNSYLYELIQKSKE